MVLRKMTISTVTVRLPVSKIGEWFLSDFLCSITLKMSLVDRVVVEEILTDFSSVGDVYVSL